MNSDIRISVCFPSHTKTKKLKRILGSAGVLSLITLWTYAAQNRPDGALTGMDNDDIAIAADWDGDEKEFLAVLEKIGWIEKQGGVYVLHDWAENNPWAAGAPERSKKAREAASKKWQSKESLSEGKKKRSERLAEAREKGKHTKEQWDEMKEFFGFTCLKCGKSEPEIEVVKDHILPIYQGGSDGLDNIQPLCRACNSGKGPENLDYRAEAAKQMGKRLPDAYKNACGTPAGTPAPSPFLSLPNPSLPMGGDKEIQTLKKLHLTTCGLNSMPPLDLFRDLLAKGKTTKSIMAVYNYHGGDIQRYRQRNIVEKLEDLLSGKDISHGKKPPSGGIYETPKSQMDGYKPPHVIALEQLQREGAANVG